MFCLAGYLGFAGSSRGASEENVFDVHFELVGPGQSSKTSSLVAVCKMPKMFVVPLEHL